MDVYNGNSVAAHDILSKYPSYDKFSEVIQCTARVNVEDAYFKSLYRGTDLPVPYLEISGSVDSVYLERPNEYFPCGTNEMRFMSNQAQDVRIKYFLNVQEMQDLIGKGLYEKGFEPPANLVGNVFEVPTSITYKGIYDTPICIVDMNDPFEIDTATHDTEIDGKQIEGNGYLTFFESCKPFSISPDRAYGHNSPFIPFERYEHIEANYDEQMETPVAQVENVGPQLSDEEIAEQKHLDDVSAKISKTAEADLARSTNVDADEARRMKDEAMKGQGAKKEVDMYANDFGWGAVTEEERQKPRLTYSYNQLKQLAADKAEAEKLQREEDADTSKLNARKADLADGQLGDGVSHEETPVTDTKHFGDSDDVPVSTRDNKKKSEADYKKAVKAARAADLADGQLGDGASQQNNNQSKSITRANDLLVDLLAPKNNDGPSGPTGNFL